LANLLTNLVRGFAAGVPAYQQMSQFKQQQQMQDLARRNQMLKMQQAEDERKRQAAFRQDFQDIGYTPGLSDPRELTDLYTEHFPGQVAEQQLKRSMGQTGKQWQAIPNRPGWKMNLYTGEEKFSPDVFESIDPYKKQRLEQQQQKIDNALSAQKWKEGSTLIDQDIKKQRLSFDKKRKKDLISDKLMLSDAQYAQKQEQLVTELPAVLREAWKGGYTKGGKSLVAEDVKDLTDHTEGVAILSDNTARLKDLLGKHGTQRVPTEERAQMETLIANLGIIYKGEQFAGLGVLQQADLEFLLKIMGDPTDFLGLPANQQIKKLNEFERNFMKQYNNKLSSRGFDPVGMSILSGLGIQDVDSYSNPNATTQEEEDAL
jgi:hypothetical protein